jgi:hypothetical protein
MDNEVLAQLVQIKWLLVVFVAISVLRVGFQTWWKIKSSGGFDAIMSDEAEFPERAHSLMDQGKHAELLALAHNRTTQFPGDALAFWYHATAAHRLGDRAEALASLRKVQNLQPDWVSTHVRPFIEEIELHGVPPQPAPVLRAIVPSVPTSQDVPPTSTT